MQLWTREFVGWILLILGLGVFSLAVQLAAGGEHYMIEAGCLTAVGFVVFRGGIHLLKVAVAARICQAAIENNVTPRGKR